MVGVVVGSAGGSGTGAVRRTWTQNPDTGGATNAEQKKKDVKVEVG